MEDGSLWTRRARFACTVSIRAAFSLQPIEAGRIPEDQQESRRECREGILLVKRF